MDHATERTAWQETTGVVPHQRASSPLAQSSFRAPAEIRRTDFTDITPVDRGEFFAAVGPCLALTGGVGMSKDDQRAWLEAAFTALDGIPIALLERGAKAALATADHPSKIVPAIMKAITEDWERRRRYVAPPIRDYQPPAAPEPIDDEERKEVAALVAGLVKKLGDGPIA